MDEQKKQKTKKIINIVVDVVVALMLVLALVITITNISSKQKGYTSLFGTAYMVVQSDSMTGEVPAEYKGTKNDFNFEKGDLISVKILKSDEEKSSLKEGDIVSFFIERTVNGEKERVINSHRIVKVSTNSKGEIVYNTRGDNPAGYSSPDAYDPYVVNALDSGSGTLCVIGVVKGNAGAIGHVLNFLNSSTGFLVCIVIPSFLIVAYFAFVLIREIVKTKKAGAVDQKAKYEEEFIAKLRAQGVQIPADLDASAPAESGAPAPAEQNAEKPETPSDGENKK